MGASASGRPERNPFFGGVNPEPIRPNVDEALRRIVDEGHELGLLLDGDADRAGAADEQGNFIHQLEVTGLLMYYLAEHRGLRDPVVVSVNNTSMAARIGKHYGIEVFESPVGYKFIGPMMIETGAMMGAEESGGYGSGCTCPSGTASTRDLLLLDLFLKEMGRGVWPPSKAVAQFHELAGRRSTAGSTSMSIDRSTRRRSAGCSRASSRRRRRPSSAHRSFDPAASTGDGVKLFVQDGSWLLIRTSGTEPLVRVYTEATSAEACDALVEAGETLVRG